MQMNNKWDVDQGGEGDLRGRARELAGITSHFLKSEGVRKEEGNGGRGTSIPTPSDSRIVAAGRTGKFPLP